MLLHASLCVHVRVHLSAVGALACLLAYVWAPHWSMWNNACACVRSCVHMFACMGHAHVVDPYLPHRVGQQVSRSSAEMRACVLPPEEIQMRSDMASTAPNACNTN